MSEAVIRFPLTIVCLVGVASLLCYLIALDQSPPIIIEKLMYTFLVSAVLGMAAQFAVERFMKLSSLRLPVYGLAIILTAGYFLILWPVPEISAEISVRTFIAIFAFVCAVLWIPAYKNKADFNEVCLIHFKTLFISALYSVVLSAGLAAIMAAIDILLFRIDYDAYSYMLTFVWILFAPIYYLSLLPRFISQTENEVKKLQLARSYPKFLEILVSYIAIPLVGIYTLVLFAYFIKILITWHWPSGQLGPMVLIYSAAGLVILVLASLLSNRFAVFYYKIFPKVLIPIVVLQLVSVGIRLNAYGVTESRYYVVLFGIFSIIIGVLLSIKPVTRNSMIALLAAALAIVSIIPPVDAFTVSRVSQINRLEKILVSENILSNGKITATANASEQVKIETTNILSYLDSHSSLQYISWLPQDFEIYKDMKNTFGFEPTYPSDIGDQTHYFWAGLDQQKPITISGYDLAIQAYSHPNQADQTYNFSLEGLDYVLTISRISDQEVGIKVNDSDGTELIGTGLYRFAQELKEEKGNSIKEGLPPEELTLDVREKGYKLKIILQHLNLNFDDNKKDYVADYTMLILFGHEDK
ncbi:MAG: DUF4153 domain-containing protein [Peptococcaceae bacterium]|nr:DUF4153 domain-containing protein [Peptococcaceae bacterium]